MANIVLNEENFKIREMNFTDMSVMLSWAALEGWKPGLYDAESFYFQDEHGFFIGELDGVPINSISAVAYGANYGFIGFYIVLPEYRGDRYGFMAAVHARNHLKDRNIGLDGVLERTDNYARLGFKYAYKNYRFEGSCEINETPDSHLVRTKELPFNEIVDYDERFFPARREKFLHYWLNMPNGYSFAYTEGSEILGYGLIRSCIGGYRIGPLFAENYQFAEIIFRQLISRTKGEKFYIDVPEPNSEAFEFARKYKMNNVFETARMYSLEPPDLPLSKIFGVTSLELG